MRGSIRLRTWRKKQGISQVEAAKRCEVSQSTFYYWENGDRKPQIEQAIELQRVTNGAVPVESWAETNEEKVARAQRLAERERTGTEG